MFLKTPHFNIFPSYTSKLSSTEQNLLSFCLPSIEQQIWILQSWYTPPFGKETDWDGSSFWSLAKVEELKNAIFKCNQLRWQFRKFLNHWRLKKCNKANEEDLFTCEVPKYPVQIVDWSLKSIWVFEAQSVMRDITNRLLHHDGCFEDPLTPRNPYTNLPLTSSQTISVWSQLMSYPVPASLPFTAYRASKMNLLNFRYEHRIYLSLYALRKTFEDISFYETREKILDFIEMAFDRQGIDLNIDAYEFALKKFPDTPQLHRWKYLCQKYHEFELKYSNFDTARTKAQDKLFVQTFPLLHQQDEIVTLWRRQIQNRFLEVNPLLLDIEESSSITVNFFMNEFIAALQQNQP
jgi:hypothetical protein